MATNGTSTLPVFRAIRKVKQHLVSSLLKWLTAKNIAEKLEIIILRGCKDSTNVCTSFTLFNFQKSLNFVMKLKVSVIAGGASKSNVIYWTTSVCMVAVRDEIPLAVAAGYAATTFSHLSSKGYPSAARFRRRFYSTKKYRIFASFVSPHVSFAKLWANEFCS